jgi:hypothetical protein
MRSETSSMSSVPLRAARPRGGVGVKAKRCGPHTPAGETLRLWSSGSTLRHDQQVLSLRRRRGDPLRSLASLFAAACPVVPLRLSATAEKRNSVKRPTHLPHAASGSHPARGARHPSQRFQASRLFRVAPRAHFDTALHAPFISGFMLRHSEESVPCGILWFHWRVPSGLSPCGFIA